MRLGICLNGKRTRSLPGRVPRLSCVACGPLALTLNLRLGSKLWAEVFLLECHFVEPPGLFNGSSYGSSLSTLRFMHRHAFAAKFNKQLPSYMTRLFVCPYFCLTVRMVSDEDGERWWTMIPTRSQQQQKHICGTSRAVFRSLIQKPLSSFAVLPYKQSIQNDDRGCMRLEPYMNWRNLEYVKLVLS